MKSSLVGAFLLIFVASISIDQVESDCCYAHVVYEFGNPIKRCDDGTEATPCCGYGGCNIFCCNCDGGCRSSRKRDAHPEVGSDGFQLIDQDGDGQVSLREAKRYIESGACGNSIDKLPVIENHFARMDRDADGFLSRLEIDSGAK